LALGALKRLSSGPGACVQGNFEAPVPINPDKSGQVGMGNALAVVVQDTVFLLTKYSIRPIYFSKYSDYYIRDKQLKRFQRT
jgi:hypothetical protein